MTITPTRRRAPAPAPWTDADTAALSAVLDEATAPLHTLYTAGYATWTPDALKATCDDLGALLLDIRTKPWSKREEWQQPKLRALFGIGYRHEPMLGNVNYNNGGPITLADPEVALPSVRASLEARPVVLLCGCKDAATCHRSVAAAYIAGATGATVVHLEPPPRTPRPAPVTPLPILPDGYTVRLDGAVATLTTPSGATCAFDGRVVSGGRTVAPPDADRARVAAHEEARRLAARTAEPPRAWARPVHADDAK